MPKFYKCNINEQYDEGIERDNVMYFELADTVTDEQRDQMAKDFLLDFYHGGEWDDEETVFFDAAGCSATISLQELTSQAEFDILVKYDYNSTRKFTQYLN